MLYFADKWTQPQRARGDGTTRRTLASKAVRGSSGNPGRSSMPRVESRRDRISSFLLCRATWSVLHRFPAASANQGASGLDLTEISVAQELDPVPSRIVFDDIRDRLRTPRGGVANA